MFAAMAAMLIASLAVPDAFGDDALLFACAYCVRADRAPRALRRRGPGRPGPARGGRASRRRLGRRHRRCSSSRPGSTARAQVAVWVVARRRATARARYVGGGRGWRLSPGHFAERHASDRDHRPRRVDRRRRRRARRIVLSAGRRRRRRAGLRRRRRALVALLRRRRDRRRAAAARDDRAATQLTMARDSYSYLHLPMVAGIILVAVAMKKTLAHVDEPLELVPAVTLCGGVALYLAAHILFRLRNVGSLNRQRLVAAGAAARVPPAGPRARPPSRRSRPSPGSCAALIAYEAIHFAAARDRVRHPGGGRHVARARPDLPNELRARGGRARRTRRARRGRDGRPAALGGLPREGRSGRARGADRRRRRCVRRLPGTGDLRGRGLRAHAARRAATRTGVRGPCSMSAQGPASRRGPPPRSGRSSSERRSSRSSRR